MREILFRGKRIDNGKWVEGEMLHDMQDRAWIYWKTPKELPVVFSRNATVEPETVGQFTGLTDKNGKRIFEGDIVHCVSMADMANMVVIFEDGEFRMVLCEKYKDYIHGCGFYAIRCFDKEIIGNIHDNPELLKEE